MIYGVDADLNAEISARVKPFDWAILVEQAVICAGRGIAVYAIWRALSPLLF